MRRLIYMLLVACTPDVPAMPSFQQDVAPILAANCVRCHGTVPLSAPPSMRLDTYGDLRVREATLEPDDPLCLAGASDVRCFPEDKTGAASSAETIAQRVADDERPMPPRFPLDSYQIEILQRWFDVGAPRGPGRSDNELPTARVEAIDGRVIDIVVSDSDRDLVGGALLAEVGNGAFVIGAIAGGRQQLTWNAEDIVPGTYALRAELDDGAGMVSVALGTITLEAP